MAQNTIKEEERWLHFAVAMLGLIFENTDCISREDFKALLIKEFGIGKIKAESLVYDVLKTPMFESDEKYIYKG